MSEFEFLIRRATADDIPFIFDSWLTSWRTSRWAGVIRNCDYFTTTRSLIEDLIPRGAVLLVADSGKALMGFGCGEEKDGVTHLRVEKMQALRLPRAGIPASRDFR